MKEGRKPGYPEKPSVDWLRKTPWAAIKSGLQLGRAEVLRGLKNYLNMDRPEHHSIDRLKERGVVQNDLCSTRQILALFRGQPWGDCRETGRSAYGPFRALRCHLELKLKLKPHSEARKFKPNPRLEPMLKHWRPALDGKADMLILPPRLVPLRVHTVVGSRLSCCRYVATK